MQNSSFAKSSSDSLIRVLFVLGESVGLPIFFVPTEYLPYFCVTIILYVLPKVKSFSKIC
nr:MAG TPA: hypothetical protein [Caudoviricetes sp.]